MIKKFHFLILILGNLLCSYSYAVAQPENETYGHLIQANSLFHDGKYEEALINYQVVIENQPSNNYVLEQIRRAEEELLYTEITDETNTDENCRKYISKYGEEGKYILNVKNILSQNLLSEAYKYYQNKEINSLENTYKEYLSLLGSVKSNEMKQWLYSLCIEMATEEIRKKEWMSSKVLFERSLKYSSTDLEFSEAQKGIERASKKIK
ncbi:hypothetical protein G3O08_08575 [Cryomorpha ignava]|uniref:Tetratricopeptide repeat protein n=1 Tax=Cryomorpha ignava TaxID=101383 RepID=A0A7K3WPZ0_9FLAO|nr:hypothetical protein [Cryomorpha ignava]NEN23554.1 hypothetical protein [Cryomorpha ignava]